MKKIQTIQPFEFEDKLILSLDRQFLKYFIKFPEFDVYIDSKNHLIIKSREQIRNDLN